MASNASDCAFSIARRVTEPRVIRLRSTVEKMATLTSASPLLVKVKTGIMRTLSLKW